MKNEIERILAYLSKFECSIKEGYLLINKVKEVEDKEFIDFVKSTDFYEDTLITGVDDFVSIYLSEPELRKIGFYLSIEDYLLYNSIELKDKSCYVYKGLEQF